MFKIKIFLLLSHIITWLLPLFHFRSIKSFRIIMSDKEKKPDLGLLEEDDEFEEFPAEGGCPLLSFNL